MNSYSPEEQKTIEEAATWYARRLPGAADLSNGEDLADAFANWLAADPLHARAWDVVQAMGKRMEQVPARIALPTLSRSNGTRRTVLRTLAVMVVGGGAFIGLRHMPGTPWQTEYATAPGQRRNLKLVDGSALNLDTRTALDVDFGSAERAIRLRSGVILVSTQPDTARPARPFVVYTPQGCILALGTRFEVRVEDDATTVSVLEDAVLVNRPGSSDKPVRVQTGERLRLTHSQMGQVGTALTDVGAWTTGQLVVWDRPLVEVTAELARYRRGWLSCDPAVADLRISGVLSLDNTDQALAALEDSFPVRVERQWGGFRTHIGPR